MTKEQAKREIDSLDFYLQNHTDDYGEESHTAMMMAIKALEQQTCEDAVSRQAVLDIFADNADVTRPYSTVWEKVKALPPVNPQYTEDEIQKMQDLEQAEIQKAYELGKTEGQNSEDAVSREAVLAICDKYNGQGYVWTSIRGEVKQLPSVNPQYTEDEIQKIQDLEQAEIEKAYELGKAEQPKTGHWTKMVEVFDLQQNRMLVPYGYDDAKFGNTPVYVCDCGYESNKNSRFCPDCGAKMVDEEVEE